MEIYEQEKATVGYTVYVDGQPTEVDPDTMKLRIYTPGSFVFEEHDAQYNSDVGEYQVTLQGADTVAQQNRAYTWVYELGGREYETSREHLIVTRPIVTYNEFKKRFPDTPLTPDNYWQYESVARRVIEVYCNQDFNREDDVSHTVMGQGTDVLHLPRRIINLKSVAVADGFESPYDVSQYVTIDEDFRWAIRRKASRPLSPVVTGAMFRNPSYYEVTGDWGWEAVPQDVAAAAAIIIHEYTQVNAKYREQYVKVISASNWRQQAVLTGDETTGNANADMILSGYKNIAFSVI